MEDPGISDGAGDLHHLAELVSVKSFGHMNQGGGPKHPLHPELGDNSRDVAGPELVSAAVEGENSQHEDPTQNGSPPPPMRPLQRVFVC